ncbi:MAG: HD domain-containing phosphohydrolase [Fimbriimonadaceae bacterium]
MLHNVTEPKLLIVDDVQTNLILLRRTLAWAGYTNVFDASGGEEAIRTFEEVSPDLVILDLHMPAPDGYAVLEEMRRRDVEPAFLPIVAFTADATWEARERALTVGASDFLTKPGEKTEIKLRVRNLLALRSLQQQLYDKNESLEVLVKERTQALEEAKAEIVNRLAIAGEFRDEETGDHTLRVGEMSARIAEELGMPSVEVRLIALAARLHDIGKVGVSDLVLLKPGKLTEDENIGMRRHTILGGRILANGNTPLLQMAERIALTHHERFDGSGYPAGLKGDEIPVEGRIVAVADVFDALTNERPYKKAWSVQAAVSEIRSLSGQHFDPRVVEAFLAVVDDMDLLAA